MGILRGMGDWLSNKAPAGAPLFSPPPAFGWALSAREASLKFMPLFHDLMNNHEDYGLVEEIPMSFYIAFDMRPCQRAI